jgi:hypothetical protein
VRLLEPLMLVFMGVMIGFIAVALLLPILMMARPASSRPGAELLAESYCGESNERTQEESSEPSGFHPVGSASRRSDHWHAGGGRGGEPDGYRRAGEG